MMISSLQTSNIRMQDTDLIYFDFIKSLRNESNDPIKGRLNPNDGNFNGIKDYIKSLGLEKAKELLAQANNIRVFYDDLQQNRKRFANGLYGYVGSDFAEYTSLEVAEDITAEGRFIFKTLDKETTKLFSNQKVKTPSGVKGLLELYIDFEEIKSKFPTIVRVNSIPKSIPHFVESVEVEELKRRGKRSLPIVKEMSERTYHSVVYGDTDSICISFDNVCTSFGIDIDNDDVKLVSSFVEYFCNIILIPFYHRVIKNLCDKRNCDNHYVLECEQIMRKLHLYAKKCYCSSLMILDGKDVSDKGMVKAGGIVVKKTSYPYIIRKLLKELLNIMLRVDLAHKNNLETILEVMQGHIDSLRNFSVSNLCNINTVRVFDNYHEIKNGRYITTKGAGVNEKGIATYNNIITEKSLNFEFLGNGSKVKTYPFIDGEDINYFSWDVEKSEEPPSFAPKPSMDILIYKNYTKNAILYITTEYPKLVGYEDYLMSPKDFPKQILENL